MKSVLFLSGFACLVNAITTKPSIIIDTDIFSGVDDVGALAIANVLHNCGLCDLKGVMINTKSQYGALATSVHILQLLLSLDMY
jgi:hypothetical protein